MKLFLKKTISLVDRCCIVPFFSWLVKRLSFTPFIHGPSSRLKVSSGCSLVNTIFNTSSGAIRIGANTIFGHNCMVLTGRHNFVNGCRASLLGLSYEDESPSVGQDISIGDGCWIASGSIILGGVSVGNNSIVCAGAVVTRSFPDNVMLAGVPARIIRNV